MIQKLWMVFSTIKPVSAFLLAILAFFAPIKLIVYGIVVLIGFDMLTGIMAHFKTNKLRFKFWRADSWSHITSSKLGNTISKTLVYMILIISGFLIDTWIITNATLYFTKLFAGASALRELKSLVENGEKIMGGGLISTIRSFIKGGFKGGVKDAFEEKLDKND
jgi:phage-related holin